MEERDVAKGIPELVVVTRGAPLRSLYNWNTWGSQNRKLDHYGVRQEYPPAVHLGYIGEDPQ